MFKKYHNTIFTLLLIIISFLLFSCNKNHRTRDEQRSFCYWKTTYNFNDNDIHTWDSIEANHLYIRYFDVGWDTSSKMPRPISTIKPSKDSLYAKHITPSIFFKNEVFLKSDKSTLDTLAMHINERIKDVDTTFINQDFSNKYSDILIDCDWSVKSKEKFFYFVEKLQSLIPDKDITTTLRLWQYKNQKLAGIPPVDRVLLMCYNVEAANNYNADNSIATLSEIKKYVEGGRYPLKVDIALPLFSWGVIFRRGEFKGVIKDIYKDNYIQNKTFISITSNRFRLNEEMVLGNFFARPGDEIRIEGMNATELSELADYLCKNINIDKNSRITFFSWDLKNDTTQIVYEIKNIFDRNNR